MNDKDINEIVSVVTETLEAITQDLTSEEYDKVVQAIKAAI